MSPFRQNLVQQAFKTLDTNKNGQISLDELASKYNVEAHPDVVSGKKTPEDVLKLFMNTFKDTYNYLCGTESDNIVTIEEFMEYYENVSMNVEDDALFEALINNVWRINNNTTGNNEKKGWRNETQKNDTNKLQKKYNEKFGNKKAVARENSVDLDKKYKLVRILKNEVLNRGIGGLIELYRQFRIFDDNNSKLLDLDQFKRALREYKTSLSNEEIKSLFSSYAIKNIINYEDLSMDLRGQLNNRREAVVLQAFDKLDVDKSGVIELSEIKNLYNCKNHRDVKNGKRTEEEIFSEFINTFQMHHNIRAGLRNKRVTKQEFIDYYSCLSSSIPDDDYFVKMVQSAWRLNPSYTGDYGTINVNTKNEFESQYKEAPSRYSETGSKAAPFGTDDNQDEINYNNIHFKGGKQVYIPKSGSFISPIEKLQITLAKRGVRGIMGMRRAFMIADENNNKRLELNEFKKFIHNHRIPLTEEEIKKIFVTADIDNSGTIEYEEFVRMIAGTMNERRQKVVVSAFNKLDNKGQGKIEIDILRNSFDPSRHPETISGRKSKDEVLGEFLDTLDYHFELLNENDNKMRYITLNDFLEFYNYISMSIENDNAFEAMLNGVFHLDSRNKTKDKY